MIRRAAVALILLCLSLSAAAASERNLDHWLDRELIPGLLQQLKEHPRFKGQTLMFVAFENNAPAPVTSQLELSLRDRLLDAAMDTPGLVLGWQQARTAGPLASQPIDCTRDNVHYYIGIELSQHRKGDFGASVRALDVEDNSWVAGFGKSWRGELTTNQRRALRQAETDQTFLGARDVPFRAEQTDILAAHLAHKMACALLRESSGDYVVAEHEDVDSVAGGDSTVQLVRNNLANFVSLAFANDGESSNARLSGKAHRIDGDLYQYWLTVSPTDPDHELATLSTSAYVSLPASLTAAEIVPADAHTSIAIPRHSREAFLSSLRVLRPHRRLTCRGCSLLSANAETDAIVFILQHQANYGLVRLADAACRKRAAARVVTANSPMEFAIPYIPSRSSEIRETAEWQVSPRVDTYYAIAVTNEKAARRLANHIDKLPLRCADTVRLGLRGAALERWLDEFATLAARATPHVDWRAIEVRDVL